MSSELQFTHTGSEKERLDLFLHRQLQLRQEFVGLTRSQLKIWITQGRARMGEQVLFKAGFLIEPGAVITITAPEPAPQQVTPYEFPLQVLHEDNFLIVINKPSGISMHPGAGNSSRTLVNALQAHAAHASEFPAGSLRPGIVHRLDKDTSGVVVIAKDSPTHAALALQWQKRSISRKYLALVFSTPRANRPVRTASEGTISAAIGRHPGKRICMAVDGLKARPAVTHWSVLERMEYACLLSVRLETGRTHQIRVHMNHIGCPVLGDPLYGDFSALPSRLFREVQKFGRQALHASGLEFTHPHDGKRLSFVADPPPDFLDLLRIFKA